jgi:hypothetical protein
MAGDAGEKVEGKPVVPSIGHEPGNRPTRGCPMLMAMETCLGCSSTAAALFAGSFIFLSALQRVLVWRRSTSATHLAFDQPDGLSFGACGFLAFGVPS